MTFTFRTPPSLVVGPGALGRIGTAAGTLLGPRVLVVTDRGVIEAGLVEPAVATLRAGGAEIELFTEVVADPPEAVVLAAVDMARRFGPTAVLGIGGGSSLDVAKLVALLARGGESLDDVYGVDRATGPRLPLVLVPTTAGTGSEVTPIAIVTTGADEKKGVVSPVLLPDIALLDPDLTLGLPPLVTAATGLDAMVHAIEAFTSASPNRNPLSANLAREALRLLGRHIERAVVDGRDSAAREAMLLGSMLAGQAFANAPVAAVHALAYPIGARFHVAHGISNSLVLPHVLRFNAPSCGAAYDELAGCIFADRANTGSLADGLSRLAARLGLPERLRDVGIPAEALDKLADDAMQQTRLLINNPRPLTRADALAIYTAAW